MSNLKEKAKMKNKSKGGMGAGVARLVQRHMASSGASRAAALSQLSASGKIKKVDGSWQLK